MSAEPTRPYATTRSPSSVRPTPVLLRQARAHDRDPSQARHVARTTRSVGSGWFTANICQSVAFGALWPVKSEGRLVCVRLAPVS